MALVASLPLVLGHVEVVLGDAQEESWVLVNIGVLAERLSRRSPIPTAGRFDKTPAGIVPLPASSTGMRGSMSLTPVAAAAKALLGPL